MPNTVVTFAATGNLVTFDPTSATSLTQSDGSASVTLNSASLESSGATTITATAPLADGGTTASITSPPVGISVNGTEVSINSLTLSPSSISAYGSSLLNATVFINGAPATVPISVSFTSPCVASGKATLSSPVTTVSGIATSTYTDKNCASATDLITASVTGGTSVSTTINVALPSVNNIKFVTATPTIIGTSTAGAATLPKNSVVKFKVVDSNDNGKAGVWVDFSLVPASAPGGIVLSSTSATSDVNGEVSTTVTSGTIPTPVWVVATVRNNTNILTQSNTLTITTGLPTQSSFSLSVQTYNIEGWQYDGITSNLTVIASDRLGNPLPDGTAINFIAEGAQIAPASCTTAAGTCSVAFKSADERPTDGRVTVLAYTLGEKSFIDVNGNNSYDLGETFYDIGDPYIDANENGLWDSGETYIFSNTPGSSACLTRPSGAALPWNYSDVPSKENTCTGTWVSNYVRRDRVLCLSGSEAFISPTSVSMGGLSSSPFLFTLRDLNNNPLPAGTTITVGENQVKYTPFGATTASKATVAVSGGTPVLNTCQVGGTSFVVSISGDYSAGVPVSPIQGYVYLNFTTPKGLITSIPVTVYP